MYTFTICKYSSPMGSLNNHDKKHHTSFTSFHHPFPPKVSPVVLQVLVRESPALHDIPLVPPHEIPMAPQCRHEIRRLCVGWSLEFVAADFSTVERMTTQAMHVISFITWPPPDGMICHEMASHTFVPQMPPNLMWQISRDLIIHHHLSPRKA